ncbi:MAG: hypothetical protein NXI24_16355 [bacterium]|nr:hypothetical protein [bacterium]
MRWYVMAAPQKSTHPLIRRARRLVVVIALLLIPLALSVCTKDQDLADEELEIFLLACPAGPFVCFDNCFQANDTDGNGIIQGAEEFGNNICSQQCSQQCNLAFLFFYLVDE